MKNTDKAYYHCATKGLVDDVLFSDDVYFIAGMNRIAIALCGFPELVAIAFCLMDNHVHFILYGTYDDCCAFMEQYKRLTEIWLSNNAPDHKGKTWDYGCWQIRNLESLQEKICYVHRNPMAAGIGVHPNSYRWGSGPLMYNGFPVPEGCRRLGDICDNQKRKLFNTRVSLPDDWLVMPDGLIWPGCYVNYRACMGFYKNLADYMFCLNQRCEEKVNTEMYGGELSIPDKDVLKIAVGLAVKYYGTPDLSLLAPKDRLDLCRNLRKHYSINSKQLGRIFHLSYEELKMLIA